MPDLRCPNCGASASLPLEMSCSDHRPVPIVRDLMAELRKSVDDARARREAERDWPAVPGAGEEGR
jgi:hypothetical protein